MTVVNLRSFLQSNLDVLFVGLNPPEQSNANGHYFSGKGSRFFDLLQKSGLITKAVSKANADEIVFGSTSVNYKNKSFGVIDLADNTVQTYSGKVEPNKKHVDALLQQILELEPRFTCIIHYKVRNAIKKHVRLSSPLTYGICGTVLPDSVSSVVMNYFPNGNNIPDETKLQIFRDLRNAL